MSEVGDWMSKTKSKKIKKKSIILLLVVILLIAGVFIYFNSSNMVSDNKDKKTYYLRGNTADIPIYNEKFEIKENLKRGILVTLNSEDEITDESGNIYNKINYNDGVYYILKENITTNKDRLATEEVMYVRTTTTLYSDIESGIIIGLVNKGDELPIVGYDKLEQGCVNAYKVKVGEQTGYVYGKYLVSDKESALFYYEPDKYHNVHALSGHTLGAGSAENLDYYPVDKPTFENNKMPDVVYALYINGGKNVISNIDSYIEFAKTTNINAFVVDIKDNEAPAYDSEIMKTMSPTNYSKAANSKEDYKIAIQKLKDAGFYVIGRITVFKDKYYAEDHPEDAIMDTRTGGAFLHSSTYWPSPYKRNVWMFNVELAKEAVTEMGFNEIQFDYVRFPDRVLQYERDGLMDFRNEYNEEKAQAIQRFLMYACDELHKLGVYVSADVFGESAHKYVTAYGQYWSAISNVVDVISAMPYPDHFSKYEYNFKEPVWTKPYEILNFWANTYVNPRQEGASTPAIVRTWIQTYDVPNYKHSGGYKYGAEQVEAQIKGLFDAGLNGGYMTWNAGSSLEKYKSQIAAYQKEYK